MEMMAFLYPLSPSPSPSVCVLRFFGGIVIVVIAVVAFVDAMMRWIKALCRRYFDVYT